MTTALAAPAASSAVVSDSPETLWRIHEPGINLCVWERPTPPALADFVERELLPRKIKRQLTAPWHDLDPQALLDGIAPSGDSDAFVDDLRALIRLYAAITDAAQVAVKLETFAGSLCERFHVDQVPLRLICSYAGPGTEWLDNRDIDRAQLVPGVGGQGDLLLPGAEIRHLERWSIGLMKGDRWPSNQGNGLVHRSPHVHDPAVRRVLFKIDPA